MTAKDAILMCRHWRNGKTVQGDRDALAKKIARVIREYKLRHPDMTDQQVARRYRTSAESSAITKKPITRTATEPAMSQANKMTRRKPF